MAQASPDPSPNTPRPAPARFFRDPLLRRLAKRKLASDLQRLIERLPPRDPAEVLVDRALHAALTAYLEQPE